MKKFLLAILFIGLAVVTSLGQACTPNTDTISGITPDTLAPAYVGVAYNQTIYFRLPHDTVVDFSGFFVPILIDSLTIDSAVGLPPGFGYGCNNIYCSVPGGGNGCASISGTAAIGDTGIHPFIVYVTVYASDTFGTPLGGFPDSVTTYFLDIQMPNGIHSPSDNSSFSVGELFPNPVHTQLTVPLYNMHNDDVLITIFDLEGKKVKEITEKIYSGIQQLTLDVSALSSGNYLLQLNNGETIVTRKFLIE